MNRRSGITLFLLCLVTVLMISMIVISSGREKGFKTLYTVVGTPFVLLQEGVKKCASAVSDWGTYVFSYGSVKAELETLRENNADIPLLEDENERLLLEIKDLRTLLSMQDYTDEYELVAADIIAEDVTDWFGTFTINVGESDGIRVGNAVITPDGLVGIIETVGPVSSKLVTIADENYTFMCRISRTNELVRITGGTPETLDYSLHADRLATSTKIAKGDNLVTADSGGVYPKGIMVGTVSEVTKGDSGVTTAVISPAVDFTLLSKVYVMILSEGEPSE